MQNKNSEQIIQTLEFIQSKPGMFIGMGLPEVVNFVMGFNTACRMFGVEPLNQQLIADIMIQKGWESTTQATLHKMKQKGYTEAETIREFLGFYITAWQHFQEVEGQLSTEK